MEIEIIIMADAELQEEQEVFHNDKVAVTATEIIMKINLGNASVVERPMTTSPMRVQKEMKLIVINDGYE